MQFDDTSVLGEGKHLTKKEFVLLKRVFNK